jgi:hypothetical protein
MKVLESRYPKAFKEFKRQNVKLDANSIVEYLDGKIFIEFGWGLEEMIKSYNNKLQ